MHPPIHTRYVDLLCFLVINQLVTRTLTRRWLRPDYLVESMRAWLSSQQTQCDWRDRIWLARASGEIARSMYSVDERALPSASPLFQLCCHDVDNTTIEALMLRAKCVQYLRTHV
ncbi:hypothetical protein [Burkholderia mayonis]|uniref:hypothetical protein n=1 Tax=Burkholderia mayonis TaxID=1385591 RepID=UPI000A9FBAEA|nr:hypothetical protein [Burkholderia mayonis]